MTGRIEISRSGEKRKKIDENFGLIVIEIEIRRGTN